MDEHVGERRPPGLADDETGGDEPGVVDDGVIPRGDEGQQTMQRHPFQHEHDRVHGDERLERAVGPSPDGASGVGMVEPGEGDEDDEAREQRRRKKMPMGEGPGLQHRPMGRGSDSGAGGGPEPL